MTPVNAPTPTRVKFRRAFSNGPPIFKFVLQNLCAMGYGLWRSRVAG
jgi:hypothetical protein